MSADVAHNVGNRPFAESARDSGPRSDVAIRSEIETRMDDAGWVPRALISFTVTEGVVELSGKVVSSNEREAVKLLVREAAGVRDVRNHLVVRALPVTFIGMHV
jgi:osmotically-inducible protein OsmY